MLAAAVWDHGRVLSRIGHRARGSAPRPARSRFALSLGLIAAAGLAVRLVYVLVLSPDLRGTGDSDYFYVLGGLIADGHGFSDSLIYQRTGELVPTALHPPLFPLLLAAAAEVGLNSYRAQRVVVCLVGAATIVLIGLLARRIAGPRAGLIAAALAALYPMLITADGAVMSESLFGLLLAAAMLAAYRLAEQPTTARAAVLGALIALAALARAEALLLLPLIVLPLALRPREGALRRLVVAGLACVLVIAPWTIRNWVEFDRFVPVSNNSGTLLAGANCDRTYSGEEIGRWVIDCVAEAPSGPILRSEAISAGVFRRHGLEYARDHAAELPGVSAVRLLRTASLYQPGWHARHAEGRERTMTFAGFVAFWLLAPVAVAGAVILRRRGQSLLVLAAPVVLALAITLIGYGEPRFRHGAELSVVVLAAVAIDRLARRQRAAPSALGDAGAGSAGSAVASPGDRGGLPNRRLRLSAGRSIA